MILRSRVLQLSSHRFLRQAPFMIFSDLSTQGTPSFSQRRIERGASYWLTFGTGTGIAWNAQSPGTM